MANCQQCRQCLTADWDGQGLCESFTSPAPVGEPAMSAPTIYHGTPLTPRAALQQMAGRAFCVSFYRPDDVEVVEAISPAVMFRQWRILVLAISSKKWAGLGGGQGLAAVLQVAGAAIADGPMGGNTRQSRRTIADKRRSFERLAFWAMGRTALAHGQPNRSALAPLRQIRARLFGLDRTWQGFHCWLRSMVPAHGRGCRSLGQSVARHSHDARRDGCARVSLPQCGQHQPSAEWTFI